LEAILVLEDGRHFRGRSFGARAERCGEVVFHTGMTGYQEILTDPSYCGQIVVMTYPEIGNCGTNALDQESDRPQVEAFAVRELAVWPSNWRATQALAQYLRERGTPGISEIDTRALTRHIRARGAMKGIVSSLDLDVESLQRKAREAPGLEAQDLVGRVSCKEPHRWVLSREAPWASPLRTGSGSARLHCVAYDFGVKQNILRLLRETGFDVTVVPGSFSARDTLALEPDAVFLSNGPGDPTAATYAIRAVKELLGRLPVFGICLGHQIAALALGARTFKLKFGHRGANHPVRELRSGRVAITSQNHGYAVDPATLPVGAEPTHVNLNDGTLEGFLAPDLRFAAVQYHPEASPGPHDAHPLFAQFLDLAARGAAERRPSRRQHGGTLTEAGSRAVASPRGATPAPRGPGLEGEV
jgi:carbamoyl-phosphate synthase small subunit